MSLWSRLERRLSDLAGEIILDDYRDQVAAARVLLDRNAVGDAIAAVEMLEALLRDKPDHGGALVLLGAARLQLHRLHDLDRDIAEIDRVTRRHVLAHLDTAE